MHRNKCNTAEKTLLCSACTTSTAQYTNRSDALLNYCNSNFITPVQNMKDLRHAQNR